MNKPNRARRQAGNITVLTALTLPVLLGFTALAIDLGNLFVVRNELQNAADAAAMAGAAYLYQGGPTPNWSLAKVKATAAIALNKAMNVDLTDGQVEYGYRNITGTPGALQSSSITPTANDLPAVQVTISKASGQNGGPIMVFFANILGINSVPVTARAVAAVSSPGYVGPSGGVGVLPKALFPVAMSKCLYDNYWDPSANPQKPKTDPATGKPYVFKIGSSYHYGICSAGQWTSFQLDKNDVPTIRDLITYGNPTGVGIGDSIWIQPGTKTTLYGSVDDCSARGDKSCEYAIVPVVDTVETHARQVVVGFACIHIDLAVGGSGKYIQVEMNAMDSIHCKVPNAGVAPSGIIPWYGAVLPPKLAQ